jgi:hypothetical protein
LSRWHLLLATYAHPLCPPPPGWRGCRQLSTTDNTFQLVPVGDGHPVSGVINSTLACTLLALTGATPFVEWVSINPPPPQPLNLDVSVATFLGGPQGQFEASGVAILAATNLGACGPPPPHLGCELAPEPRAAEHLRSRCVCARVCARVCV